MQEELKRSTQKVLSAEERAQEIDSRLTEEEEHLQQLEKDIAKMREKQVSFSFLYTVQPKNTTNNCPLNRGCIVLHQN